MIAITSRQISINVWLRIEVGIEMSMWPAVAYDFQPTHLVEGHLRHPLHSLQISENVVIISVLFLNRSSNPVAGRSIAFSVAFLLQAACSLQLTSDFVVVVCKLPLNLTYIHVLIIQRQPCNNARLQPRVFLNDGLRFRKTLSQLISCGKYSFQASIQSATVICNKFVYLRPTTAQF